MTDTETPPHADARRRQRYGLLLAAIVSAFAVQGTATPGRWEQPIVVALLGVTLLLALWVAKARPVVVRTATVVVGAIVIASLVQAIDDSGNEGAARIANALLVALAPPAIMVGVARNLRAEKRVTLEAVMGVLSVYLLVGMLFAAVYGALDRFGDVPFFAQSEPGTVAHFLYFSFTTLTTTGYGDLTARTDLGHTLAVSEALVGQIYLVTIVSLIVSNLRRPGRSRPSD